MVRSVTAGFGSLWVGVGANARLVRIDPVANRVLASISLDTGLRRRVEAATGDSSAPVQVGVVRGVALLGNALWVADATQGSLLKIE